MGIGELLDKIREHYLSKFIERINSIGDDEKIFIEPAFRDSEGNVVTEGALNAGSRVDVAIVSDKTETINFDFDGIIAFEQLEFLWENTLTIKLNPFQWDYCSLIFTGNITNWDPLKRWYSKWFSENPKEGSMLSDCVHFISDPEAVKNGYHVYVDFGSADVAALEEVFDAAKEMGAIEVSVGNA
jgi:hypothetical protein